MIDNSNYLLFSRRSPTVHCSFTARLFFAGQFLPVLALVDAEHPANDGYDDKNRDVHN